MLAQTRRIEYGYPMSKRQQAIKLAAAANVGPDTAMRWLDGGKARSLSTHLALEAAAKKLKIERATAERSA